MADSVSHLIDMAEGLWSTSTKGGDDWVKRVRAFVSMCAPGGQLIPEVARAIPFNRHAQLLDSISALEGIGRAFNVEKMAERDLALSVILKLLRGESGFAIGSLEGRRSRLTDLQRKVIDTAWDHLARTGKAFPIRSVQPVLGKTKLKDALHGLGGCVIREVHEENTRALSLPVHGILLSYQGPELADLLVKLLVCVKDLYEADHQVKGFRSDEVTAKFGESESALLLRVLRAWMPRGFPIHVYSVAGDQKTWEATITDDVIGLYQSDDVRGYLEEFLSEPYQPDEPIFLEERMNLVVRNESPFFDLMSQQPTRPVAPRTSEHIDLSRIEDLGRLSTARFDCARLVAMCKELNDSASRGNAHAVIYLTRAILDHVPPIFGCDSFAEVASNYGGEKSFRRAMERLEKHSRHVADLFLHRMITKSEVRPNMKEVSFDSELNLMLSEVYRILK